MDRDPRRERERREEEEVVNNSEFLWSGLVRSFGQDRRRGRTSATLQRVFPGGERREQRRDDATLWGNGVSMGKPGERIADPLIHFCRCSLLRILWWRLRLQVRRCEMSPGVGN